MNCWGARNAFFAYTLKAEMVYHFGPFWGTPFAGAGEWHTFSPLQLAQDSCGQHIWNGSRNGWGRKCPDCCQGFLCKFQLYIEGIQWWCHPKSWLLHSMGNTHLILLGQYMTPWFLMCYMSTNILTISVNFLNITIQFFLKNVGHDQDPGQCHQRLDTESAILCMFHMQDF